MQSDTDILIRLSYCVSTSPLYTTSKIIEGFFVTYFSVGLHLYCLKCMECHN